MKRVIRKPPVTFTELCERWTPAQQELVLCIIDWVNIFAPTMLVRPIAGYNIVSLERPPGGLRRQILYAGPHHDDDALVLGFPHGIDAPDPEGRLYGDAMRMRRFRLDGRPDTVPWHLLQPLLEHELASS